MSIIVKQSARALLFDREDRLVLIKRTKPGQDPYWVTVGGGLEATDTDTAAAACREVAEEIGGHIGPLRQVLLLTDHLAGGIGLQHIYLARLEHMDLQRRTGDEFTDPDPARGSYEVVHVEATHEGLDQIRLQPPQLAEWLQTNIYGLRALLAQHAPADGGVGEEAL